MYCNASLVRGLTPLLTTEAISDENIREFIYQAESILNNGLGKRYAVPISAKSNLSGTIAITANSATVTGSNTSFLSEVYPGDIIQVNDTREALKVLSVASNTSLTASSNAVYTDASSSFFVIPRDIVTAAMYLTAMLIILTHFSEQAYNQDTATFNTQYSLIAKDLIESITKGDYLNTDIVKQVDSKNANRYITVTTSGDIRSFVNDSESLILESFPGV